MHLIQLVCLRIIPRLVGLLVRLWIRANGGNCGKGLIVESGFRFKYPPHKGISIGNNVCIGKQTTFDVPIGGKLKIGNDVSFTGYLYISSQKEVVIGNHVIIGEFTSIRDSNHGFDINKGLIKNQKMISSPIIIGNDIWIGTGVIILTGVKIEDGIIIGANSLVNKDLTNKKSINVGIPAKFIKYR